MAPPPKGVSLAPRWTGFSSPISFSSNYRTPGTRANLPSSGDGRITANMASYATGGSGVDSRPDANIGLRRLVGADGIVNNASTDHLATVTGLADPFVEGANGVGVPDPFTKTTGNSTSTPNGRKLSAMAASFTPRGLTARSSSDAGGVVLPNMATPGSRASNSLTWVVPELNSGAGTTSSGIWANSRKIGGCVIFHFHLETMWHDKVVSDLVRELLAVSYFAMTEVPGEWDELIA